MLSFRHYLTSLQLSGQTMDNIGFLLYVNGTPAKKPWAAIATRSKCNGVWTTGEPGLHSSQLGQSAILPVRLPTGNLLTTSHKPTGKNLNKSPKPNTSHR